MVSNGSIAPSDRIDGLVDDAFELVADLQQMQWHADVNLALATVEAVARLRQTANQLLDLVANEASAQGASWAAIGERAGMSRQAARQRWSGEAQPSYESPVALGGKRERPWED